MSLEGSLYSDDEFEQEQCQWCYEMPYSKFNSIQAIEQYVTKARIEENEFYTRCPDKKIMNDAAKYRIAELKKGLRNE